MMQFGVGLWTLRSGPSSPRAFSGAYDDLLEDAHIAEGFGLDTLWISEHHFTDDGYCPSVLTAASAVLAATRNLRVGTGVLLLPLHAPERVLAAARSTDLRSGGRLDLGVGLGYRPVEFVGKGVPLSARLTRFRTGLDVLRDGAGCETWVGTSSDAGARRAGRRGLSLLLPSVLELERVGQLTAVLSHAWNDAGRPGGRSPRTAVLRDLWIVRDRDEGNAVFDWLSATSKMYADLGYAGPSDDGGPGREPTQAPLAGPPPVVGSVEEVIEHVRALNGLGVDQIVIRLGLEGADRGFIHQQMERFATEVVPVIGEPL